MTADHDLHAGLRRAAEQLEQASTPTDVAAVIGRRPPASPRPARAVLAAAAVLALLVGVVALLASEEVDEGVKAEIPPASVTGEGEGTTPTSVPDSSASTETTTPDPLVPVPLPSYEGTSPDALPASGLAFVDQSQVALTDMAGTDLATFATGDVPGVMNDPTNRIVLTVGPTGALRPWAEADATDCAAAGGGGVRVAVCGAEQEELVRLDPSGARTTLAGRPFGAPVGRWRWAEPSPDGQWVLGTFSVECEVPFAVIVPAAGGEPRTADGFTDLGGDGGPFVATSHAVGWSADGRAIVSFEGTSACGTADPAPGTYLVDPVTGERTLLRAGNPVRVMRWERRGNENDLERAFGRATAELGLEGCCGEPAHGGGGLTGGVVWAGRRIPVGAVPLTGALSAPLADATAVDVGGITAGIGSSADGSDALAFTCGEALWIVGADGSWVGVQGALRDLAAALIPRLYCTAGPPPGLEGG